jgi:hypothetical protein
LRRLPAEVAYDAVEMATASDERQAALLKDVEPRAIGPAGILAAGRQGRGANANRYALMVFGRPARETNCDCERSGEPTLLATLFLRNDQEVLALIDRRDGFVSSVAARFGQPLKLAEASPAEELPRGRRAALAKGGAGRPAAQAERKEGKNAPGPEMLAELKARSARLAAAGKKEQAAKVARRLEKLSLKLSLEPPRPPVKPDAKRPDGASPPGARPQPARRLQGKELLEVIEAAYLRTLSRPPTEEEVQRVRRHFAAASSPVEALRDLMWALVNSKEFIVNH